MKLHIAIIQQMEKYMVPITNRFAVLPGIPLFICTTNSVKTLHLAFRKVTKTKGVFPTDAALQKMLYLAYLDISKKLNGAVRDWSKNIAQLAIHFEERLTLEV